jgi:hypothetical protein
LFDLGMAVNVLNLLVVPADRPWRGTSELVAAARERPATLA